MDKQPEGKAYIGDEIVEGNFLIAKFMGWTYPHIEAFKRDIVFHESHNYDTLWDKLMPVVKKVSDVINPINWDKVVESLADVDIVNCHAQMVLSITWYNQNKQS